MKSFPHFTQHDQMDCGPTCLRMIAAFYGKHYTLNEMREISFITHLGVSMLGISMAAENLGFHTIGVQISWCIVLHRKMYGLLIPLPVKLNIRKRNFAIVGLVLKRTV